MDFVLPKARSMTKDERKAFRDAGFDPAFLNPKDGPTNMLRFNSDVADWIEEHVYGGPFPGNTPTADIIALAEETYALTYNLPLKAKKEEKNF